MQNTSNSAFAVRPFGLPISCDLSASIHRMATLAEGGRIRAEEVEDEIKRLHASGLPHLKTKFYNIALRA